MRRKRGEMDDFYVMMLVGMCMAIYGGARLVIAITEARYTGLVRSVVVEAIRVSPKILENVNVHMQRRHCANRREADNLGERVE